MRNKVNYTIFAIAIALLASSITAPMTKASTGATVTIVSVNIPTSLNPETTNDNLTINTELDYLQRSNFFYIDDKNSVVPNTNLGTYRVINQSPFRVQYTINSGLVWSDGTPMTAVDLLLDHVTCSSRYSIAAGLGNPAAADAKPAFNSLCYGGSYGERVAGLPTLSADKMSMTIEYDRAFSEWTTFGPRPFPVHALVLAAEGRTQLQNEVTSISARSRFETAFYGYDTRALTSYGNTWSNAYKITNNGAPSNPLLFVSSGGYIFDSYVPNQSITFRYNDKYGAGPEVQGVSRIVYRIISDGNAAVQALRNQEVDVYSGLATADGVAAIRAISTARVVDGSGIAFEHLDLRTGSTAGNRDPYTGVFSGDSQRAKDLRKAFLLMIPRDDIIERVIRPVISSAVRLDSLFYFSNETRYQQATTRSGISALTRGTQAEREAEARSLVAKYFPNVSATTPAVKVNLLWGTPTNSRRVVVAQLIRAAGARSGFDINAPGVASWSTALSSNSWDGAFFAWVRPEGNVGRNISAYCTTCSNNYWGWSNPTIDSIEQSLKNESLSEDAALLKLAEVEREIYSNALSIPLFQHPAIYGVSNSLQGFKPSASSIPIIWNYWEWTRAGLRAFPRYLVAAPQPSPSPSISPSPTPTPESVTKPKPDNPTFSGVNFVGNKINVSVNIGSGTNRPDKVYLVAPKLGITSANPMAGSISGSTATWSLDFDKLLSGAVIPLEIVSERDGVKSDPVSGSYQAPTLKPEVTSVPVAPSNFKSRIVGSTAVVTATAQNKVGAEATNAFLFGKSLGISKSSAIEGEVVGSSVVLEVPIRSSMAGKKFPVTIYLSNSKGESRPLNATLTIPAAPKKPKPQSTPRPTAKPKPSVAETIICIRPGQTRPFAGTQCPPGWTEG